MQKFFLKILVLFVAVTQVGCLHWNQQLRLDSAGGGGAMSIQYSMPVANVEPTKELLRQHAGDNFAWFFDSLQTERKLRNIPGIRVRRNNVIERDSRLNAVVVFDFENLDQLMRSGLIGEASFTETEQGTMLFSIKLPEVKNYSKNNDFLRDVQFSFSIRTPRPIEETNGEIVSRNEVQWKFNSGDDKKIPETIQVSFAGFAARRTESSETQGQDDKVESNQEEDSEEKEQDDD